MLSTPKAVAPRRAPADHAASHTPVAAQADAAIPAPPSPVVITERQVMLATAAAGIAAQTAVTRRPWIVVVWQRLSLHSVDRRPPRRHYQSLRPSYIERAAMARAMDRL